VAFDELARIRRLEVGAALAALLIFTCAAVCETVAGMAAAPSASAVPVSTTRREMRWHSFLPLFMIDSRRLALVPVLSGAAKLLTCDEVG
jgi:hypothetical protein